MLETVQRFEPDLADAHDAVVLAAVLPLAPAPRLHPEPVELELPGWIWGTMALCYGIFFGGLLTATGNDGEALFALIVSVGYAAMYFGTAGLLFGMNPPRAPSAFARGLAPLQTWTGPMGIGAVAGQVLTVPGCLAFFGAAIAVIRLLVTG
jgi:hypothetical protein